jgi:signal peptidase
MQSKYTTQQQIDEMRSEIKSEKQQMARGFKKRSGKKALTAIGWILFLGIVIFLSTAIVSVNLARSRGEIPRIFGYSLFVVQSGSMEPTFNIGTVILCKKPYAPDRLKAGNVVTFHSLAGYVVTHRIVEVISKEGGSAAYHTKGDNPKNSVDQEVLTPDRVLAVFVAKIPMT